MFYERVYFHTVRIVCIYFNVIRMDGVMNIVGITYMFNFIYEILGIGWSHNQT